MEPLTSNLLVILLSVSLVSALAMLCLLLQKVFEQMGLFQGTWAWLMAALTSIGAVAGTALLLLLPDAAGQINNAQGIRLDYPLLAVMAVTGTIILLQLFVVAAATARDETDDRPVEKPAGQTAKTKGRGRPKKEKAARPLAAQGSVGKAKSEAKTSNTVEKGTTT